MTSTAPTSGRRIAQLLRCLAAAAVVTVWAAAAAWADDSGEVTGITSTSNFGIVFRLLIFTVIAALVISVLAALPRLMRRPRYRPGKPWEHDPLWFAGPENPERALTGARPDRRSGGASADW